jgi:hypothetical protein
VCVCVEKDVLQDALAIIAVIPNAKMTFRNY